MGTPSKKKRDRARAPLTPRVRIPRGPRAGTAVIWPIGVQERYGISFATRWRWEKTGRLPPRDVFLGGHPIGWRPATLDRADSTGPGAA